MSVTGSEAAQEHTTASSPHAVRLSDGSGFYNASSGAVADKAAFTEGTTTFSVVGGVFNETPVSDPTEDQAAAARITAKRAVHVNLRNTSGTEVGTSGAPVRMDPTGTTAQPVTDNGGSLTVDGTVSVGNAAGAAAVNIQDGGNSITIDGSVTAVGSAATDAPVSGNPVYAAGRASNAVPTAMSADGDAVPLWLNRQGALATFDAGTRRSLGMYYAHSGRLAILASAHAATAGFFWLINPVGSSVVVSVRRVDYAAGPVASTAFASLPRITVERVTFTGTASGATITPAKRDSNDSANTATVRTASTGLTLTAGATITAFLVPPTLTIGATPAGIAIPVPCEDFWEPQDPEQLILRAGEGVVVRQSDNGTTADTRIATINVVWEEF